VQVPVDLVIDHSVQVDVSRSENAVQANMEFEFHRNKERFAFLKWGSNAFQNMLVVPPGSGIVHQVRHLFHQSVNTVGISCFAMFPKKKMLIAWLQSRQMSYASFKNANFFSVVYICILCRCLKFNNLIARSTWNTLGEWCSTQMVYFILIVLLEQTRTLP
jgi:hypothetical protein